PPTAPPATGAGDADLTTDAFRPKLTAEGRTHPVTSLLLDPRDNELRWARLPALEGINRVPRLRAGATTLLTHPTLKSSGDGKPAPVLVVGDAGKGRTLALLTDSGWHWGFLAAGDGDDGRAFQRFWENGIRWLVRDPALTLLRLELDRLEYRRNQPVAVRVRAMHADYSPAPGVEVTLAVASTAAADAEPVRSLHATTDADGEAHVDVGTLPPGAYRLTGRATIDARAVTHDETFVVRSGGPELDDVAARDRVLREIAQASGGSYAFEELRDVAIRSSREVRVGRQQSVE